MEHAGLASSQALARVGAPIDLYYSDAENAKVQAIPVEYNTRYSQEFSNKGTGVSVFLIPPGNGLRHVVIALGYNAASINTQTGSRALPRGWGYSAISQISFRIGGSSQYFLSGQQLLARNMRLCRTQSQRDAILQLGGAECKVATDFDVDQYAYIPVSVWASPADDGICLPLPADLLSQPVQVTCQLNPTSAFWTGPIAGFGGGDVAPPAAFDVATYTVEQFIMADKAMSLASRVDLNTHSYGMPLPSFDQQVFQAPLAVGVANQQIALSGFRAGEVTKLQIWLTKNSTNSSATVAAKLNPNLFYAPKEVTCLYAGVIFAQYLNGSSKIWNLLDGTAPAAVNQSVLAVNAGAYVSTAGLSQWAELPFAMPSGTDYEADVLRHGKQITNGIVNLQITPPDLEASDGATTTSWTLNVAYVYNATASFSKGSCDLIF
jgi:hypothetical protein